jgi:hypothetical protein
MSQDFGDGFAVLESGPGSAVTDAMVSWFVEKLFEVTTAAERRRRLDEVAELVVEVRALREELTAARAQQRRRS